MKNSIGKIDPIHLNTLNLLISFNQFISSNFSDDTDPKQMKYKVEFKQSNKVLYSNFAGRTVLLICKEIFGSGKKEDLINEIKAQEEKIVGFKYLIANSKEYNDYNERSRRFFDKDDEILIHKNEKWYLTSEHTEESLNKFSNLLGEKFEFKLTILK